MKTVAEAVEREGNREIAGLARAALGLLQKASWEEVYDSTDAELGVLRLLGVVETAHHGATVAMLDRLEAALRCEWTHGAVTAYAAAVVAAVGRLVTGHRGLSVYYTHALARVAEQANRQGATLTLAHCELARFAYASRCYRVARRVLAADYYGASERFGALSTEKISAFFYYAGSILFEEREYARAAESLAIALGSAGLFFEKYAAYNLWVLGSVLVDGNKRSLPAGVRIESVDEDGLIARYSSAVLAFEKEDLEASLDALQSAGKEDSRANAVPLAVPRMLHSGEDEMPFGAAGTGRKRPTEGEMADSAVQRQIASYASEIDDHYERKLQRVVERRKELYVESQKKAFTSVEAGLLPRSLSGSGGIIEDYILRVLFYGRDDFAVHSTQEGTYINFAARGDLEGELESVLGRAVESSNRLNDLNLETVTSARYKSIIHHPQVNANTIQDMRIDGSRQQPHHAGRRTRLRPDNKYNELLAQGLEFDLMASGGSSESDD